MKDAWQDKPDTKSGFFPLHHEPKCTHPEHGFPNMIHIPAGQGYRHVCPGCGAVQIVHGSEITM